MKSKVFRYVRETGHTFEIGSFECQGDALWCATLFESHKVFCAKHGHYVQCGKKIMYPAAAIDTAMFNCFTLEPRKAEGIAR